MATTSNKSTKKSRPLEGQIAIVTGASRGIGRGIALQLGQSGATVYITGRAPNQSSTSVEDGIPTLEQTAKEIADRGGVAIPIYCDHSNDEDVKNLFERVEQETGGALDILVNSAYSAVRTLLTNSGKKFFEIDPSEFWDDVNNVGLRNVYICCVYAARMMAKHGTNGLIVNISSAGGLKYLFAVPYGVGKAAVDRMSADMAHELYSLGITVVSLWPGLVKTELIEMSVKSGVIGESLQMSKEKLEATMMRAESTEFVGKAVVALAADKKHLMKSGKILITADLGNEYGFSDEGGVMPGNIRSVRTGLEILGWKRLARWIPGFVRIPKLFLHFGSYKF